MMFKQICTLLLLIGLCCAHESCNNTEDVMANSLEKTLAVLDNADDTIQEVIDKVMEAIDCEDGECKCFNATVARNTTLYELNVVEREQLFILLLRYLNNVDETCDSLCTYGDQTLEWQFNLGFFTSHSADSVIQNVIANIVSSSHHDEDSHSHEDSNGDSHEGSHENSHEDSDGHSHSREEQYYELDNGCSHIECLDTVVMIRLLNELGVYSTEDRMTLFATLLIEHIVSDKPIAVECGSNIDIDDLPTAEEIIQDMLSQVGAASNKHLTYAEFDALVADLGLGSEQEVDSHEDEDHLDHRRRKRDITQCLSAEELYSIYGYPRDINLTGDAFSTMCPSLVQQLLSDSCIEHEEDSHGTVSNAEKYGYGTLATFIMCIAALPGIFMYPIAKRRNLCYRLVMAYMIGLAVGSLFADAMLHLLPEAYGLHSHDHDGESGPQFEDPLQKSLLVLAAALAFFILESIMTTFVRKRQEEDDILGTEDDEKILEKGSDEHGVSFIRRIKPVGWMVIIGDSLHNFVDGLAMGAAFSDSVTGGISTSIAVFCHELPHELGDFAVLVNSGFTIFQAAVMNFLSACTCFAGLYVGIAISVDESTRVWIFAITAGMFMYIALSVMVPEAHKLQRHKMASLVLILEILGMLTGAAILLVISLYEGELLTIV